MPHGCLNLLKVFFAAAALLPFRKFGALADYLHAPAGGDGQARFRGG